MNWGLCWHLRVTFRKIWQSVLCCFSDKHRWKLWLVPHREGNRFMEPWLTCYGCGKRETPFKVEKDKP